MDSSPRLMERLAHWCMALFCALMLAGAMTDVFAWPRAGYPFYAKDGVVINSSPPFAGIPWQVEMDAVCAEVFPTSTPGGTGFAYTKTGEKIGLVFTSPIYVGTYFGDYYFACKAPTTGAVQDFSSDPRLKFQLVPDCAAGASEKSIWQTTIATGSTGLSVLPQGPTPEFTCKDWCKLNTNSLTYRAWVEPGHTEVGAKLWVELNATNTGAVCYPSEFGEGLRGTEAPTYACTPGAPDCTDGTGGSGSGAGTGLDTADKANLATTATQTTQANNALRGLPGFPNNLSTAYGQLDAIRKSMDAQITGDPLNCTVAPTCTGDPARCAEFAYARRSYCSLKPSDDATAQAAQLLYDSMVNETPAQRDAALSAGSINLFSGIDRPRWLTAGTCPAPTEITLGFGATPKQFKVNYQPLCDLGTIFSLFVLAGAGMIGLRIFAGGFN